MEIDGSHGFTGVFVNLPGIPIYFTNRTPTLTNWLTMCCLTWEFDVRGVVEPILTTGAAEGHRHGEFARACNHGIEKL